MKFRSFGPLSRTGGVRGLTVHRLHLVAIDGHCPGGHHADLAAELDKPGTGLADRWSVVFAEVSDCLVVRHQPAGQPHDLDIAPGLFLETPAGRDPVHVTIDEELQKHGRMIAGSPCLCGRKTVEISSGEVERVDESIDHPNWMVVADPVLQTIREQGRLLPVHSLDIARHHQPPLGEGSMAEPGVFTQPRPTATPPDGQSGAWTGGAAKV
ncbi:hypothetical protein GGQ68_003884 [Sagittula marina]|uniref:Uncharacterized protein n=1 Tax=Sagittula marina TaxID=943940 RepID=A0A7W6DV68_9RHOB|nr:hypothetical protein [Sagittula marina]